jgi:hypothetical protein
MENATKYRIVDSFTVSHEQPGGELSEFKLAKFSTGDYGIFKAQLSRQPAAGGDVLKTSQENIIAFGQELNIRRVYEKIMVGLVVDRNTKMMEELKSLKAVKLNENEKIEAKIVNIRPSMNDKTDVILSGHKTWLLKIPTTEAKDLNVGQKIVLQRTEQGLRIDNEKNQQILLKINR